MSYSQVLPYLIKDRLIVPKELRPMIPPYPPGFDVNARCDFHAGAPGHSTEDCKVLKSQVQKFLDSKMFSFAPRGLQINNNPSPSHEGPLVHVIPNIGLDEQL
ncbi:unnamed protein product [Lathyrus oleraceus]